MASQSNLFATFFIVFVISIASSTAQLSTSYYDSCCPGVFDAVRAQVKLAMDKEPRMGASLVRQFFHDCFVNGCDGSILLDDTATFTGEKNAAPNRNSARGFEVIDAIKATVEQVCPGVVSCADVVAISARDSVVALGGPSWDVKLGRRDARTASQAAANSSIPVPTFDLNRLISSFQAQGLSIKDLVALSVYGHHILAFRCSHNGQARCTNYRARIYNETNIDGFFARTRQAGCPRTSGSGDNNLAPLDIQTPTSFDNSYFKDLISKKGLLHSDQQLFNGGSTDSLVTSYSQSSSTFNADFVAAMIRMGDIKPLTGSNGEIRKNCRKVN